MLFVPQCHNPKPLMLPGPICTRQAQFVRKYDGSLPWPMLLLGGTFQQGRQSLVLLFPCSASHIGFVEFTGPLSIEWSSSCTVDTVKCYVVSCCCFSGVFRAEQMSKCCMQWQCGYFAVKLCKDRCLLPPTAYLMVQDEGIQLQFAVRLWWLSLSGWFCTTTHSGITISCCWFY